MCGDNGICYCGQCQCKTGYTGLNCGIKICEHFEEQCRDENYVH